jgi:malate dehydrogenase (oxaloacetate-decarboxylating)(NADP+)
MIGVSIMIIRGRAVFVADTTVTELPTPRDMAETAVAAADLARRMGHEPRVAMLSFSTFGNPVRHNALQVREAVTELDRMKSSGHDGVDFEYDGEMSAEVALDAELMHSMYPFCRLSDAANVLVMPGLHSANITSQVIKKLAGGTVIGPLLVGLSKPVQIVPLGATVGDLVNTAALAAHDALAAKR